MHQILTNFAARTPPIFRTNALIFSNAINACATTKARLRRTFVYINAAVRASEALSASTSKPSITRFAGAAIKARLSLALINGFGTKCTAKPIGTYTHRSRFTADYDRRARSAIRALSVVTLRYSFRARFPYLKMTKFELANVGKCWQIHI